MPKCKVFYIKLKKGLKMFFSLHKLMLKLYLNLGAAYGQYELN